MTAATTSPLPSRRPEGLASGQRSGGKRHPRAEPRHPRGAPAENWRRRDPAADPGPKAQPRRRKANVQSSAHDSPPAAELVALAPRQQQRAQISEPRRDTHCASAPQDCPDQDGGGGGQDAGGGCARGARPVAHPDRRGGARSWLPCSSSCSCCYCNDHARSFLLSPPGGGDAGTLAETQEAKDMAVLAAAARATSVPATKDVRI